MPDLALQLLIICPLVFLAGFIDAIAGGGGIISIPAYLLAGLPAHTAAGTNKMVASCGTTVATIKYFRSGHIKLRPALAAAATSFVGASIGTSLALLIPESTLKIVLLTALPLVAIFLLFKKDIGSSSVEKEPPLKKQLIYSAVLGLFIGCYDGLIGPGTGTFFIIGFSSLLGFDLVTSSGCAKVSNLASNIASMILFILNGKVMFLIAIPAALCTMTGGYLGARLAVKGGAKWVRIFIFVVLGLLFVKTILEFFGVL